MCAAQHDSASMHRPTMKTPLGLVYAVVITVAILAVVLYSRSQSSPMVAPATIHVPPPEPATDRPAGDSTEKPPADSDARDPQDAKPKEPGNAVAE